MAPPDYMTELASRIVPIMSEYGLTGFALVGYHEDGDGKVRRVCIINDGGNPAVQDGLRPVIQFAHLWGATPPPPSE